MNGEKIVKIAFLFMALGFTGYIFGEIIGKIKEELEEEI